MALIHWDSDAWITGITESDFVNASKNQGINPTWRAIWNLIRLPYWERVWIVQEVVLPKAVLLICDDVSLDMEILDDCVSILRLGRSAKNWSSFEDHQHLKVPNGWCKNCWVSAAKKFDSIIQTRQQVAKARMETIDTRGMAMHVYSNFRRLKATDPKDLVYGLLGLSKLPIEVNYNKTLDQVYADYVRYWIESTNHPSPRQESYTAETMLQRYHFLLYAGLCAWSHNGSVPSWVPNLESRKSRIQIPQNRLYLLSASNETVDKVQYPDLIIPKVRIQRVRRECRIVIEPPNEIDKSSTIDKGFLSHLRDLTLQDRDYVTGIPILQAVCRALAQDDEPNFERNAPRMVSLIRALMNTRGFDETYRILDPKFRQPFTNRQEELIWFSRKLGCKDENWLQRFFDINDNWQEKETLSGLWIQDNYLMRYRFFETEDGYLGMGPLSLRPDDELCLIRNCTIPVLLRKKDDHYVYVGPCWIVGLDSEDELKRLEERGRVERCDVTIR
ncbi:hypothetical protein PG984_015549 [Apiospora sp. TS-2023a]